MIIIPPVLIFLGMFTIAVLSAIGLIDIVFRIVLSRDLTVEIAAFLIERKKRLIFPKAMIKRK